MSLLFRTQTAPVNQNFKPVLNDTIEDVNKSVNYIFFKKNKATFYIGLAAAVAWEALAIFIYNNLENPAQNDPILLSFFVPVVIFIIVYVYIKNKVHHQFMMQFAQANGYSYQEKGSFSTPNGSIFNLGHSPSFSDIISGTLANHKLQIFNYRYVTGSGKSQQTHNNTIFQIEHSEILPPILLVAGSRFFSGLYPNFSQAQRIKLEGDFNNYFTLYTRKEFEIEALEILTPDFMEDVKNNFKEFSLELNSNEMYIYYNSYIETKAELQKMYEMAEYLLNKLEPILLRMTDDLKALYGQMGN